MICPECKEEKDTVCERACGYHEDVNNDPNYMEVCCDDCEHEHIMDI